MNRCRVLLADDHSIFREGLKALLEGQENLEIVGESDTCRKTHELCKTLEPDLVILDLSMPDSQGLECISEVRLDAPSSVILILSMHNLKPMVSGALDRGANGYVEKDLAFEELVTAIQAVLRGEVYLSSNARKGFEDRMKSLSGVERLDLLTPRELEVFRLFADGWPTKTIAVHLDLSPKTIESHRSNIMNKLECFSVVEMTKLAIRAGIVEV